jgi:hypothetical protein
MPDYGFVFIDVRNPKVSFLFPSLADLQLSADEYTFMLTSGILVSAAEYI